MAKPVRAYAAGLLLLLSADLFSFARGALLLNGYEVSPDLVHEAIYGHVEQIQVQTPKRNDLFSSSAGPMTTGSPVRDETHPGVLAESLRSFSERIEDSTIIGRNLQDSGCADATDSITVTSSVFPLLEGCLEPGLVEGDVYYTTTTAVIAPLEGTTSTEAARWYAFYLSSPEEYTQACASLESADDVDPSEATWYCDADGDGLDYTLADDELVVSCGCSLASPSPIAVANSPSPVSSIPEPSPATSTCGEGDSFSIVSQSFPDAEGCFLSTGLENNDNLMYTTSGTTNSGQIFVIAVEATEDDGTSTIVWTVTNDVASTSTGENQVYCNSVAAAALYHPAEVPLWACDTDGDGVRESIENVLSVSCGCSTTPTPETGATPAPVVVTAVTAAPVPVTSVTDAPIPGTSSGTCSEGDAFSISSVDLPDTEGCYIDTAYVLNDIPIYTISGNVDIGQIWMVAIEIPGDDDSIAELYWALVDVATTSSSEEDTYYCLSSVEPNLYHPADVPEWSCQSAATISLDCGCSGSQSPGTPTPVPSPTSQPASPISREMPTTEPSPTPRPAISNPPAVSDDDGNDDDVTNTSVANACTGDGSFTVTANAAPDLDGCYKDTGPIVSDTEVTVVYTVSGTVTVSEIWIIASTNSDIGEFNWFILDVSDNEGSSEEGRVYCYSEESASIVNPGNASWNCDFVENGDFSLATENDVSITCGSCGDSVLTEDTSTASKLVVGVVTAAGAGIVASASACGNW